MRRRLPTLPATAALVLLALAACGSPAADGGTTRATTSRVSVSPGGLGGGGVDRQAGMTGPVRAADG